MPRMQGKNSTKIVQKIQKQQNVLKITVLV